MKLLLALLIASVAQGQVIDTSGPKQFFMVQPFYGDGWYTGELTTPTIGPKSKYLKDTVPNHPHPIGRVPEADTITLPLDLSNRYYGTVEFSREYATPDTTFGAVLVIDWTDLESNINPRGGNHYYKIGGSIQFINGRLHRDLQPVMIGYFMEAYEVSTRLSSTWGGLGWSPPTYLDREKKPIDGKYTVVTFIKKPD